VLIQLPKCEQYVFFRRLGNGKKKETLAGIENICPTVCYGMMDSLHTRVVVSKQDTVAIVIGHWLQLDVSQSESHKKEAMLCIL